MVTSQEAGGWRTLSLDLLCFGAGHVHDGKGEVRRFLFYLEAPLSGHGFNSAQGSGERNRKLLWAGYFIRCCCCWCFGVQHHGQTAPAGLQWHQRDWGLLLEAPLCCCMRPRKLSVLPATESPAHSGLQAYGEEGKEGEWNEHITLGQNPTSSSSPYYLSFCLC